MARRLLRASGRSGLTAWPWPTQATTGYVNAPGYAGSLADGSTLTPVSNTTYSGYSFPSGLTIPASVTGVTFSGCRFTSSGGVGNSACNMNSGGNNGIKFRYCTFEPQGFSAPPWGGVSLAQSYQFAIYAGTVTGLQIDHCDIWGFGNAVYADGSTQESPHIFSSNYIHDACPDDTYHTDGIGLPGGGIAAYVQITGNSINSAGNTNGLAYQVSESAPAASYDHFTITGNLFGGWGYAIQLNSGIYPSLQAATNTTFTGNTFTTQFPCNAGPLYDNSYISEPDWLWRNNKWMVPAGAYWGHRAYDGYYWLPGFTSNAAPGLDELAAGLVGTSDYAG